MKMLTLIKINPAWVLPGLGSKGDVYKRQVFTCEGQEIGRMELTAKDDVPKGNFFRVIWDLIAPVSYTHLFGYGAAYAAPEPPEIAADSYLLADLKTGRVFMSKDIHSPQVPASLTKIMTLFIAFDEISQGKPVSYTHLP